MNALAKWVALGWSVFCFVGVIYGLINASIRVSSLTSEAEKVGGAIGIGIGLTSWIIMWLVIAGPALFIYLLTRKPAPGADSRQIHKSAADTKICPACAEEIKVGALKCKHCGEIFNPDQVAQAETLLANPTYCPHCRQHDVTNAFLGDGSFGPFCLNCKTPVN